ncbi:MAG: lactate utilization protein [Chitinophagaceae bacterium]|nr:lactate utilization protein [Anaerolineae bacterium]
MTLEATINYATPVSYEQVLQTADAVRARGINVEIVDTAAEALEKLTALIPAGATLMTGMSQTLQDIGLEARLIDKAHPWINLKDEMLAETDPAKQMEMRRNSTLSPYFVASVQAIVQTGEIVVASGTGSQLPAYAYSSPNVIWVAGVQKIVPTLDDALRRLREYSLPQENIRMQALYGMNSVLGKILIIEQEPPMMRRNITLILVNEPVGI